MFLALWYYFWNLVDVQNLYIGAFLISLLSSSCWAGVASNPFLRPGSNRPPPQATPPPPPKPVVNPSFAQEVEFRGYFLLKGIPHFCVFNKKANFGEWIKLTEKTHEEFEAQAFDLETETLTLAFNGQNFNLGLEQRKSSTGVAPPPAALPKVSLPRPTSASGNPRVMPPRPSSAPKLPDWLASRMSSRTSSNANPRTPGSLSSPYRPMPTSSSRINPPGTTTGYSGSRSTESSFRNVSSTATVPPGVSSSGSFSSPSSISFGDNPNPVPNFTSSGNQAQVPSSRGLPQNTNLNDDGQNDLENLPPPPPPPNILPPSPPPDILPSLDE